MANGALAGFGFSTHQRTRQRDEREHVAPQGTVISHAKAVRTGQFS